MHIKSANGYNILGFDSIHVSFDEAVTYLIGPNGAGKSSAGLNLIWFVMQGIAEKASEGKIPLLGERYRFIGPDAATGLGEIVLVDEKIKGEIRVIRKLSKSGTELSFSGPVGMKLDQQWLNDLFNIFLIAPKRFIDLAPIDQARALGIDTSKEYDLPIAELKIKFTQINKELSKYDNLEEVAKVETVPMEELQIRKDSIKAKLNQQYLSNQYLNKQTRLAWENEKKEWDAFVLGFNDVQNERRGNYNSVRDAMQALYANGYEGTEVPKFVEGIASSILPNIYAENFYPAEPIDLALQAESFEEFTPPAGARVYIKELPDDSELIAIDLEIFNASQTNIEADKYTAYIEKLQDKEAKAKELKTNKGLQEEKVAARVEYIKAFEFPFSKLSVDDNGGLLLEEKPLKPPYFSTGELIRIVPTLMAALNPLLKYVFIQDFNLLDDDMQKEVIGELTGKGFQLVIEYVGKQKVYEQNCILLKEHKIVDEINNSSNKMFLPQTAEAVEEAKLVEG